MTTTNAQRQSLEHLLAELRRVSAQVYLRVQEIRATVPVEEEEFRGLYVSDEEVERLLTDATLFSPGSADAPLTPTGYNLKGGESRLARLQRVFNLSPFELDTVLICLAPELELRYERLYAYLQDDVTRRRPTVDLTLRLLCPGLAGQVVARRCFDPEAPLVKYRILEIAEDTQKGNSLLARTIRLDDSIVAYLLGEDRLDARLRTLAEWSDREHAAMRLPEAEEYADRLTELAKEGFVASFEGHDEATKLYIARKVCENRQVPLARIDLQVAIAQPKIDALFRLLDRELRLRDAALYVTSADVMLREEAPAQEVRRLLTRLMKEFEGGLVFLSTIEPLPAGLSATVQHEFQFRLQPTGYIERQQLWEQLLGADAAGLDLESLSSRFRLNSGQIVAAVATAYDRAVWRDEKVPTLSDLEHACRAHSSHRLSNLARKITPNYGWNDIILPPDQFSMLREISQQVKHRLLVYEKWGFGRKLSMGKGLNVVFSGPSGTGKTMSAEIIAKELSMDLYKIDLSNMVSKYIGETEKNLEKIFNEAGESSAILFFDEADSLFGKRSEVKDAHDRYANIETGYLLQKMEEYDGIVILATNLRKNLDEAFVRRMHFMIEYPFPEEEDRLLIWQKAFPKEMPLGDSLDLRFMARQFKLAGGNIKNTALASAFLAAGDAESETLEMHHLIRATRREYQKLGKLCTESDFGPYYYLVKEYNPNQTQPTKIGLNGFR
jgi:hypothetical protein